MRMFFFLSISICIYLYINLNHFVSVTILNLYTYIIFFFEISQCFSLERLRRHESVRLKGGGGGENLSFPVLSTEIPG